MSAPRRRPRNNRSTGRNNPALPPVMSALCLGTGTSGVILIRCSTPVLLRGVPAIRTSTGATVVSAIQNNATDIQCTLSGVVENGQFVVLDWWDLAIIGVQGERLAPQEWVWGGSVITQPHLVAIVGPPAGSGTFSVDIITDTDVDDLDTLDFLLDNDPPTSAVLIGDARTIRLTQATPVVPGLTVFIAAYAGLSRFSPPSKWGPYIGFLP